MSHAVTGSARREVLAVRRTRRGPDGQKADARPAR